jgi:hypothetical protein
MPTDHGMQAIAKVADAARNEAMKQYAHPEMYHILVIVYEKANHDVQSVAGTDPERPRMRRALQSAVLDMMTNNQHEPVDLG